MHDSLPFLFEYADYVVTLPPGLKAVTQTYLAIELQVARHSRESLTVTIAVLKHRSKLVRYFTASAPRARPAHMHLQRFCSRKNSSRHMQRTYYMFELKQTR